MKSITKVTLLLATAAVGHAVHAAPITRMVGNWHFDQERGQVLQDSSGFGRNGTLGDTGGIEATDPVWIKRRFDNAALSFDGNQFVKVSHARHLEPQAISVEAWVKPGEAPVSALPVVAGKGVDNDCGFSAYALYIHSEGESTPGEPYFYVAGGTAEQPYIESPAGPNLLDGQWHHLVGTYDRNAIRLYVDGVEAGTGTAHSAPIPYASFINKDLYIGKADGSIDTCPNLNNGNYVGEIDEVRIWNKALTPTEVAQRYLGY